MKEDSEAVSEREFMVNAKSPVGSIDPKRARFPCCIVWTPLPVISWFIPFIGHIGICREDGVILDFAGPNFVCVDHFAFGAVARYLQISKEQCLKLMDSNRTVAWDELVARSVQEFQHNAYNLFTCNCHSFVANNLNRMSFGGHDKWNVVNLAILIFLKGKWVSKTSFLRAYLPFLIVMSIGCFFGGSKFLVGVLAFAIALISWFLVATYCFKSLIQL